MALSVIVRPQGAAFSTTGLTATFPGPSTLVDPTIFGSVFFYKSTGHGLANNDIIYISSNYGKLNGYWRVYVLNSNEFAITENTGNLFFFSVYDIMNVTGSITYYKYVRSHNYNALHLPIIYKLYSNLWPTNSVDTARTVSSYSNDSGYVKLTLSGTLTSTVTELEFVKVTFTGGTSAIYQILSWWSNSVVTINLAYIGGITFVSVQYYYNNYHARIRIYAGLQSSHKFGLIKPYELMTEQKCIPDSNGIITLNINEFIKNKVDILKNDLLKETIPNNLDAFCQFYITYAEAYDYSIGGYTLLDYIGSYTDDSTSFQGFAVNADLPFKNVHSGYMSDYVYGDQNTKMKFLTPSLYPVCNVGYFFDISFVNQIGTSVRIKRECYKNGALIQAFIDYISDYGVGIYRYEVTQSVNLEDRIDLTVQLDNYSSWIDISEKKTITVNADPFLNTTVNLSWLNYLGGFDFWTFKTNSDFGVVIEGTKNVMKNIFPKWPSSWGESADVVRQETSRDSSQTIVLRAENLTSDQVNDLFRIKTSPLVQIVTTRTNRRNVLVDTSSFVYLQQSEKLFNLEFTVTMTDNLPSQSL